MSVQRFLAKPVEVEAIRWTGDNEDDIDESPAPTMWAADGSLWLDGAHGVELVCTYDWIVTVSDRTGWEVMDDGEFDERFDTKPLPAPTVRTDSEADR